MKELLQKWAIQFSAQLATETWGYFSTHSWYLRLERMWLKWRPDSSIITDLHSELRQVRYSGSILTVCENIEMSIIKGLWWRYSAFLILWTNPMHRPKPWLWPTNKYSFLRIDKIIKNMLITLKGILCRISIFVCVQTHTQIIPLNHHLWPTRSVRQCLYLQRLCFYFLIIL